MKNLLLACLVLVLSLGAPILVAPAQAGPYCPDQLKPICALLVPAPQQPKPQEAPPSTDVQQRKH